MLRLRSILSLAVLVTGALFQSAPLGADSWLRGALIALSVYLVVEVEKALVRASGLRVT